MRKATVLGALALAGTLASPTFADDSRGWRLGMSIASDKLEGDFSAGGFGTVKTNEDRFGYGLFGGYTLNKWFAVEVGLLSGTEFNQFVPEFAELVSVVPPQPLPPAPAVPDQPAFFNVHNDVKGLDATAVFSWWVTDKFSLFGRGGFLGWRAETSVGVGDFDDLANDPVRASTSDNGFAPVFGFGVQTKLDGALLRFEYRLADVGDLNFGVGFEQTDNTISSTTLSIVWQLR